MDPTTEMVLKMKKILIERGAEFPLILDVYARNEKEIAIVVMKNSKGETEDIVLPADEEKIARFLEEIKKNPLVVKETE